MKNRLKTSIACPLCQGKIGIMSGLTAPTPFAIRCPHCRTWLRVHLPGLLFYVLAGCILIAMVVMGAYWFASIFGPDFLHLFLWLFMAIMLLADVGTCLLFYTYAKFAPFKTNKLKQ